MMHAILTLHLNQSHAGQLAGVCAAYRAHAWQALEPTPERNQTMRAIQAVQGRLSQARTEGGETLRLEVCEEEKQALRQVVCLMMQAYGAKPASEERNRALGELASLRLVLERACRQAWAL